ncbi:hypothetical protein [Protaetiibacter mangrovi]|uniref:Uncharacterized protein n=1 Tax=Protaetiibacter mangrovi TaxID=2970926 RepID=A0ABT1ZD10_9MICO|nr:hypothetical protein [Protaetiibacter mangrovi]MCS0498580.1 hypothetical protein [Protaetiibacter mangrovi]
MTSTAGPGGERYIVQPVDPHNNLQKIPLFVGGVELASLRVVFYLEMDSVETWLKAVRTDFAVHSTLDRTPLLRLEYRADMHSDPIAHWQIHAERGSMSHLLARAHHVRPDVVAKPHDMSSLHFPVGGERFRPCLEDVLQFLVHECGIDAQPNWLDAVESGRVQWRRFQLRTAVRDAQAEAAAVLAQHGWTVTPPAEVRDEYTKIFTRW